jgi:hypothetical protein
MKQFELITQYQHCFGKTQYSSGIVKSELEAQEWVQQKEENSDGPLTQIEKDPVCTCTASFCPLKFQRPTYTYRIIEVQDNAE